MLLLLGAFDHCARQLPSGFARIFVVKLLGDGVIAELSAQGGGGGGCLLGR